MGPADVYLATFQTSSIILYTTTITTTVKFGSLVFVRIILYVTLSQPTFAELIIKTVVEKMDL